MLSRILTLYKFSDLNLWSFRDKVSASTVQIYCPNLLSKFRGYIFNGLGEK